MWGRFEGKTIVYGAALLGAAFLLCSVPVKAQELPDAIVRLIEEQCEAGGGDPEELAEYLTGLMVRPLDLNMADRETLEAFPLMTPFMVASLLEYRAEYGAVSSEAELSLVDGFDAEKVRVLRPFVTFLPGEVMEDRRLDVSGKLLVRSRWELKREKEETGGLPVPLLTKFNAELNGQYGVGFTLESDAGERGFPDFYSFYVSAGDIRLSKDGHYRLVSAVAGNYSLRFGQGLVLWSGFSMSSLASPSTVVRRQAGVRPYTSTDENNYFHGAGLTLAFPAGIEATVFYSDNGQDAKVEGEYFVSKPEDGLHDSDADRAARDALRERVAGMNVSWKGSCLKVGATVAAYRYDKLDGRRTSYYNSHLRYNGWWGNASVDFLLSFRGTRIFGEAALDKDFDFAGILGAVYPFSSSLETSVVYRYYSKDYVATHAGAYCRSNVNNEHGASAALRWTPVRDVTLSSSVEYTHFPYARFGVRDASDVLRASVDCGWTVAQEHTLYAKVSGSYDSGRGARQVRLRTEYSYAGGSGLELSTRFEGTWAGTVGGLLFQEAGYRSPSGKLRCSLRLTLFWTEDWDSRVYCYEGDVPGSFSVPAYYGKGTGLYALLTYKPVRWFNLSLKCSASKYADREKDCLRFRLQLSWPF